MKKTIYTKILFAIYCVLFVSNWSITAQTKAGTYFRQIYTQTETPDYTFGDGTYAGWYFPFQLTTSTYPGFGFTVEFSTGDSPINRSIFIIGTEYQSGIDYCLDFKENNTYITVSRHVKQGNKAGFYDTDSWNKYLLDRNTNYVLNVEIDETRFRYSIYEKGFEKDIKYEYEFYGLASSYFRQRLMENRLSVAVNVKNYAVQSLSVYDLGYGIGVEPVIPEHSGTRYAYIINNNSNLYFRRDGSTGTTDYTKQAELSGSANDIWKITPVRQLSRTIDIYPVSINNMYKNTFIAPLNCSVQNDAYICEKATEDCSLWSIIKENDNNWYLRNSKSRGYLSIRYDSKSIGEYGIQKMDNVPIGGKWRFENVNLYTPLLTGYYTIRVAASNKFMSVLYKNIQDGAYVVQHSNDHSDAKVWYIEEQPEGTYSIKNMDTNKYLAVEGDSFSPNAYLIQKSTFNNSASEKWIIDRNGFYYTIKNFASGKPICIRYDYLSEDEYFIQVDINTQANTKQLDIQPVNFNIIGEPFGGMYMLRSTYSNKYLTVQNQSKQAGAYLVTTQNPEGKASWWTIEKENGGALAIRNVNSAMYLTVQNRSSNEGAYLVQQSFSNSPTGDALWHFHSSGIQSAKMYFINNVFSSKSIFIQDGSLAAGAYITQQTSNNEDLRMRWQLVPVSRTSDANFVTRKAEEKQEQSTPQLPFSRVNFTQFENNLWSIHSIERRIKNITVISINGIVTKSINLNSTEYQLDLSSLSTGIYIINVILDDESCETKKIRLRD